MLKKVAEKQIWIFAVVLFVWGLIIGQLIIPWQIPDETTHLKLIGSGIKNEQLMDVMYQDMGLNAWKYVKHPEEKIKLAEVEKLTQKAPSYTLKDVGVQGLSFLLIKHLPAAIGIFLGLLLRLPTYWVLTLGELFNLLFYVAVCTFTLKIVPNNKTLFAVVMLIPMNIQQAASISYDAVLLPLCYLFVGMLYGYCVENKKIVNIDIIKLVFIWTLITYIKMPYGMLGLLFFMIPIDHYVIRIHDKEYKIKNDRKSYIILLFGLALALAGALYALRNNEYVSILLACMRHPRHTVLLLLSTIKTWWKFLMVSIIGEFGWLDTPMSNWMIYVSVILLFAIVLLKTSSKDMSNDCVKMIAKKSRIILFVTSVFVAVIVVISMIRHTYLIMYLGTENISVAVDYNDAIYRIPYVGGLQGRYFLPALLPLCLSISEFIKDKANVRKVICIGLVAFWIVTSVYIIKVRYFG